MRKTIIVCLIYFFTISCGTSKNNYEIIFQDTSNYTIKEAFPNYLNKMEPGCIDVNKFNQLKRYLIDNYKINIDSVGTLNIFYIMPKNRGNVDSKLTNYYENYLPDFEGKCALMHSNRFTKLNHPLLLLKSDKNYVKEKWLDDKDSFIYDLFLNYENKTHFEALLTISKDRSYFLDWEIFSPTTFNAFGNELLKYKCE